MEYLGLCNLECSGYFCCSTETKTKAISLVFEEILHDCENVV